MCAFLKSTVGPFGIAGAVILAVAFGIAAWAVYLLILGWGDPETYRHVRGRLWKALGLIALAAILNAAPGFLCG